MQKYPDNVLFGRHGESVFVEIDSNDIPGYRDFSRLFYDEFSALESNLQVKASLFPGRVQLPNHLKPFPSDRLTQMALNALQAMKDDKRFAPLLGMTRKHL